MLLLRQFRKEFLDNVSPKSNSLDSNSAIPESAFRGIIQMIFQESSFGEISECNSRDEKKNILRKVPGDPFRVLS